MSVVIYITYDSFQRRASDPEEKTNIQVIQK
jgi:hypothetical protein